MKPPKRLQPLVDEGLVDTVVRQLMSGKEAMVFVVRSGDETLCAKVYKEATHRSFRQAVDYTENRKVKNSRAARAMAKGTRYGREVQEMHCPMYREGQGGNIWLQPAGKVRNPFFGASMLECFDRKTTLPTTTAERK